jgi:hypothetical protein
MYAVIKTTSMFPKSADLSVEVVVYALIVKMPYLADHKGRRAC